MQSKALAIIFFLSICGFLILTCFTSPITIASKFLLIPFVLLFLWLWTGLGILFKKRTMHWKRAIRLAAIPAGVPVGLLVLQSIGQLSIWDTIIVVAVAILGYLYSLKMMSKQSIQNL